MIGKTVSHYRIIEKLDEGGMGVVYLAEDIQLGRRVALKFLPADLTKDLDARERFKREARAASALDHAAICTIYEVDETSDGQLYLAMAFYDGQTLKARLADGPLPMNDAVDIARQVAAGLARAHEQGIVHRDVKPANLIVTRRSDVKILDFGIAKLAGEAGLTRTDVSVGTLAYMAPEQANASEVGPAADLWALGVVLYEMIAGRSPFAGKGEMETLAAIMAIDPVPIEQLRPEIPAELATLVAELLVKDPDLRPRSAADVGQRLAGLSAPAAGGSATLGRSRRGRRAGWIAVGAAAALVLGLAAGLDLWPGGGIRPTGAGAGGISSIAVLPLDNLSGDPEQEFFSDGMTDELINELARIGSFRVISRTSAMQYKDRQMSLPAIAAELGVEAVLEGSVRRSGDRVRVTTQLVHGVTDETLWTGDYEEQLADVLLLQRDVAGAIVSEIRGTLTVQEAARLADVTTVDPEAHESYLWGRYYWNRRTAPDLNAALEHFQQAVAVDPDYAAAYAGLADTYTMLGVYGTLPAPELGALAKEAALRALALDPESAQGYKALGYILFAFDWDWAGAEDALQRAVELSPNDSAIRNWYATFLMAVGRTDEAMIEITTARELDPLSPIVNVGVGLVHMSARRYDDAIAVFQDLLSKVLDFPPARLNLVRAYFLQGNLEEATAESEALVAGGGSDEARAELARVYAAAGRDGEARGILESLRDPPRSAMASVAVAWFQLGDSDEGLRWFTKAYDERDLRMVTLNTSWFDGVRSDPRFQDLVRRMNFPAVEANGPG